MKTIHPFPARMAPDTISRWIEALPSNSTVLDPMCGSGVVVRQSLLAGHNAIGVDIDPLAVLMSSVWTKRINVSRALDQAHEICVQAKTLADEDVVLPWIDECEETMRFTHYWFAPGQRSSLRRLSFILSQKPRSWSRGLNDLFWIALSRAIITKHVGASLAWDIPHSRPHKVRTTNDYDVLEGFMRGVTAITKALIECDLPKSGRIYQGDSRSLKKIPSCSIDAVFSSPPYLNAIDYIRGHKFSLIWMGYSIPRLRAVRAISIGAERAPDGQHTQEDKWDSVTKAVAGIQKLPIRQQRIIMRYVYDAATMLGEFRRVLRPGGQVALVLGDSCIRGQYIKNSVIYSCLANNFGFEKIEERQREIEVQKRYLPIVSNNNTLENRMRSEIIQVYSAPI